MCNVLIYMTIDHIWKSYSSLRDCTVMGLNVISFFSFLSLFFSTVGLFARPHSHVSSQSHESAFPSSPSRMGLDQTCTSHSSETSSVSEVVRNLPKSPSSIVVKEEPCDIDTVLIKWEMSEERYGDHQESADPGQHTERLTFNSNLPFNYCYTWTYTNITGTYWYLMYCNTCWTSILLESWTKVLKT